MVILPIPKKMEERNGQQLLEKENMIVMDASCPQGADVYARLLQEEIRTWAGMSLGRGRGTFRRGDILLKVNEALGGQRYTLETGEEGAVLCGGSLEALGYAVQTLRQVVRQSGGLLPGISVDDEPDIQNRGFFFDITRGRILSLESLKWLADIMAFYKMKDRKSVV